MFSAIRAAIVIAAVLSCGAAWAQDMPSAKRTVLGKYLSAKDAYDRVTTARDGVLFLDVRAPSEIMFVGMAEGVDAVVPFTDLKHPLTWDARAGRFQLEPNADFIAAVEAVLKRKGLGKSDTIIVMCRSGERSAKAVNALAQNGYAEVWSVHDGFEGDLSKDGRRSVNGWKNAALPWSYKLDKSKLVHLLGDAR